MCERSADPDLGTATGRPLVASQKSDACRPSYLPSPPRRDGILNLQMAKWIFFATEADRRHGHDQECRIPKVKADLARTRRTHTFSQNRDQTR